MIGRAWIGLLLAAYPERFRRTHAVELREYVAAERRHSRFSTPLWGGVAFWSWISLDLVRSGARLRRAPDHQPHQAPRPNRGDSMGSLLQDLRYAGRSLAMTPILSLVIVVTLTLGIGMNTAIFSVVNDVLLQPLDYTGAGELVFVRAVRTAEDGIEVGVSAADYFDIRDGSETLEAVGAVAAVRQNLTGIEMPHQVEVGWTSGNLLSMLGAEPAIGRVYSEADPPGTMMLGHEAWQRWFGGDEAVLGMSINLDDTPHTIVGVLPPDFRLEAPGLPRRIDVWKNPDTFSVNGNFWEARNVAFFRVIGRRAPGTTLDQVRAELDGFAASFQEQYPDHAERGIVFRATPLREEIVGDVRPTILMLFGAVGLVLLIACANVMNLLLARAQSRRREIGVRVALGCGRGRIIRLLLAESALLASIGGVSGVLLAVAATRMLNRFRPPQLDLIEGAGVDGTALLFALAAALSCVLAVGLLPALGASAGAGASMRVSSSTGERRTAGFLVSAQLALSLVLLIGAGLLATSLARLQSAPAGFDAERTMTFSVSLPSARYDFPEGTHQFFTALEQRILTIPGVEASGLVWPAPLSGRGWGGVSAVRGVDEDVVNMDYELITAGYFEAAGVGILEGRTFTESDRREAVIVNRALAERAWPGESALGRVVSAVPWGEPVEFEVIGVVDDVRGRSLRDPANDTLYFDSRSWSWADWEVDYIVRTAGDPSAVIEPIRSELMKIDGEIPMARPRAMAGVVADELAANRFALSLLGLFAVVAALLATVGLYGVMSYSVGRRRREIGIRMVLGSDRSAVLGLVMGRGAVLTATGVITGLLGAAWLSQFLATLLYEVNPMSLGIYAVATVLLSAAALLAAYIPARRASGLDPATVLRSD